MKLIGESNRNSLILLKEGLQEQEIYLYHPNDIIPKSTELLLKRPSTKIICHASLQQLTSTLNTRQSLLSIVYQEMEEFTASLFLLENPVHDFNDSPNITRSESTVILEEVPLVKSQTKELRVHLLPPNPPNTDPTPPVIVNTPCLPTPTPVGSTLSVFRNQIVTLSLEECITVYDIETTLNAAIGAKIEIISSDFIPKNFWWSQWCPEEKALAFAYKRKPQMSSIDEESVPTSSMSKPILSFLQFHGNLPRESVLNIPLDNENGPRHSCVKQNIPIQLIQRPSILRKTDFVPDFRILLHSSGQVFLFQMLYSENQTVSYSVNGLHHNKTLKVTIPDLNIGKTDILKLDVCLVHDGQFVAVLGYPYFLHILDIGIAHGPTHHLILDWASLNPERPIQPIPNLIRLSSSAASFGKNAPLLTLIGSDLSRIDMEINSSMLIPLILKGIPDFNFTIAVIHYLVIHLHDVNAVKKILYEMGRSLLNPHLTEVFQEFLIANSFLLTQKQLMANMKIFLNFIPYSSLPNERFKKLQNEKYSIELIPNTAGTVTMLLSPSQRILPHTVTDLWTKLWDVNEILSKSTRFCHRSVSQKLLVSLQCYQPEALSRATTPMSPSSPMVCNSLGDIGALFGRRTSELQLPFVEHESCTANKQEYVYSVNLRELSTHLLKERRDWPLHGQTVAGKYMGALVDSARLLCHLLCLTLHLQPSKTNKNKGFNLIDSLPFETKLKLFMLFEHFTIALGTLACPLPQGFTPFFAYLGYRVLKYDQFLWHVRSGTFDLQIDLVKIIMEDMSDAEEENVSKKLHLISLLPKSRGMRVLNAWSHPTALRLRARQHTSDLLNGVTTLARKSGFSTQSNIVKLKGSSGNTDKNLSPLDTFFFLLTAKANAAEIDLGLLTEATMVSMKFD